MVLVPVVVVSVSKNETINSSLPSRALTKTGQLILNAYAVASEVDGNAFPMGWMGVRAQMLRLPSETNSKLAWPEIAS